MPAKLPFFDTNVLLYAYSNDSRGLIAKSLLAGGGVIGVQQLNEFVAVARRKFRVPWSEVHSAVEDLLLMCPDPVTLTLELHNRARHIAERYQFSIYDAAVVAAAEERSCRLLYSEDMQDGQAMGKVTIRNPFGT